MDSLSREILYLGLAPGDGYGWGIASKYLSQELGRHMPAMLLAQMPPSEWNKSLPGPFFQALKNHFLDPVYQARGTKNYGYVFFEDEPTRRSIENAAAYDIVFTGSSWCTEKLRHAGISNAETLIQGVDQTIFYPGPEPEEKLFTIFSGGKFEYRKGQIGRAHV